MNIDRVYRVWNSKLHKFWGGKRGWDMLRLWPKLPLIARFIAKHHVDKRHPGNEEHLESLEVIEYELVERRRLSALTLVKNGVPKDDSKAKLAPTVHRGKTMKLKPNTAVVMYFADGSSATLEDVIEITTVPHEPCEPSELPKFEVDPFGEAVTNSKKPKKEKRKK